MSKRQWCLPCLENAGIRNIRTVLVMHHTLWKKGPRWSITQEMVDSFLNVIGDSASCLIHRGGSMGHGCQGSFRPLKPPAYRSLFKFRQQLRQLLPNLAYTPSYCPQYSNSLYSPASSPSSSSYENAEHHHQSGVIDDINRVLMPTNWLEIALVSMLDRIGRARILEIAPTLRRVKN